MKRYFNIFAETLFAKMTFAESAGHQLNLRKIDRKFANH